MWWPVTTYLCLRKFRFMPYLLVWLLIVSPFILKSYYDLENKLYVLPYKTFLGKTFSFSLLLNINKNFYSLIYSHLENMRDTCLKMTLTLIWEVERLKKSQFLLTWLSCWLHHAWILLHPTSASIINKFYYCVWRNELLLSTCRSENPN